MLKQAVRNEVGGLSGYKQVLESERRPGDPYGPRNRPLQDSLSRSISGLRGSRGLRALETVGDCAAAHFRTSIAHFTDKYVLGKVNDIRNGCVWYGRAPQ